MYFIESAVFVCSRILAAGVALGAAVFVCTGVVQADTNAEVAGKLSNQNVYITNQKLPAGATQPGDLRRLQAQVDAAASHNVDEKLAIVAGFPSNFHSVTDAAAGLQGFLDYSGVLILVSPRGMGISSDLISTKSINSIIRRASPTCRSGYAACAILAGKLSVPAVRSAENNAFHDSVLLIGASLVGLAAIIGVLAFAIFKRRRTPAFTPT